MTIYRLFYEARDGSDKGEARYVTSEKVAAAICREHNYLYRRFRHTYEEVEVNEAHSSLLTNPS